MTRTEFEEIWDGRLILPDRKTSPIGCFMPLADVTVRGRELVRRAGEALMHARDTMMRARDTLMGARFGERNDTAVQPARSESEIVSTEPESGDESGLMALAILLRCHGIAADPAQIRHRMGAARLGVTEILRCCQGIRAQGAGTEDELEQTCSYSAAGNRRAARRRLPDPRQSRRRQASRSAPIVSPTRNNDAGRTRGDLGRRHHPDDAARVPDRSLPPLRYRLVCRRGPQVSPSSRRGAGRIVLPSDLRPHLTAVLPGGHRQGARASKHEYARRSDHRSCRADRLRGRSRNAARLSVRAHDEPYRRRARRPAVSSPDGVADRIFPGPPRRRFGRTRPRAREYPPVPDELGAYARHRSAVHRRLPCGDVLLLDDVDADRSGVIPVLHRHFRGRCAAVSPAPR